MHRQDMLQAWMCRFGITALQQRRHRRLAALWLYGDSLFHSLFEAGGVAAPTLAGTHTRSTQQDQHGELTA